MIPLDIYLSFIAYACATTFPPGPNNILMLAAAGQFGFRRCIPLLLGIWTGLITVMLLAGGFCSTLGKLIPGIVPYFKFVGAAYIFRLAWMTLMRKPPDKGRVDKEKPLGFRDGFLLQFLNVKVIMLGLIAYPGYFLPLGSGIGLVIPFAVSMTACCAIGNLIWTIAGSLLYRLYDRYFRQVNAVMAALLAYCAVKILMI